MFWRTYSEYTEPRREPKVNPGVGEKHPQVCLPVGIHRGMYIRIMQWKQKEMIGEIKSTGNELRMGAINVQGGHSGHREVTADTADTGRTKKGSKGRE